ncbi:MAG: hypothetical protein AAF694_27820, partial [Bacteroidota bacterium]
MAKHIDKELEASKYVKELFLEKLSPNNVFHNFSHTEHIVEICRDFGTQAELSKKELQNLLIAAWFCETGFTKDYASPWRESVHILQDYLGEREVHEERIKAIVQILIGAFLDPQPQALAERILYDAYWSFLGEKKLDRVGNLLRMEKEKKEASKFSVLDWQVFMQNLLLNTKIYTPWALEAFGDRKNRNVDEING